MSTYEQPLSLPLTEEQYVQRLLHADGTPLRGVSCGVSRAQRDEWSRSTTPPGAYLCIHYKFQGFSESLDGHVKWIRVNSLGTVVGISVQTQTMLGKPFQTNWRLQILWIPKDPTANGGLL